MNDHHSTHDRIRAAAAELFAHYGYGGTSMAAIAAEVGVRKASLYAHVESKEALLIELLDDSLEAWAAAGQPALESAGNVTTRLRKHLESVVAFALAEPQRIAIVRLAATQVGGDAGNTVRRALDDHHRRGRALLREVMAKAVDDGELEGNPEELVAFFCVVMDGLLTEIVLDPPEQLEKVPLEAVWSCLWRGLGGER